MGEWWGGTRRVLRVAMTLLIGGSLVAGCSLGAGPDSAAESGASPSAGAEGTTESPSASPPTTAPAALVAADGTNATACQDGRCQVLVTDTLGFVLGGKFSCEGISFVYTAPNQVLIMVTTSRAGQVNAQITGTGHLKLTYGLTVLVEQVDATGAVIRVKPEKNDTDSHKATGSEGLSLWSSE
jgi:hypothetical protein